MPCHVHIISYMILNNRNTPMTMFIWTLVFYFYTRRKLTHKKGLLAFNKSWHVLQIFLISWKPNIIQSFFLLFITGKQTRKKYDHLSTWFELFFCSECTVRFKNFDAHCRGHFINFCITSSALECSFRPNILLHGDSS